MKVIGKARRRVDGRAKVTGQTRFADDIVLPRMLHMKLLRSPHAHALIEEIDTEKAKQHPGVHLVLTGKDFPVTFGILPVMQDEQPLAPEHVRYVGDPIAAVVAKDEQTATQALDLIQVRYRVLHTISMPEEALAKPEPRIHAYSERGNIHRLQAFEFGNVDEALARSDHVFEDLFFYEGNTHLPIEQHAAVAALDGEGKLTLWSSTQVPHYVHRCLARVLRVPASQIRVIACPNGGGFGGKCDVCNHEMVVAKAAMLLGRPVKICLNREEVFYMHRGRHPVLMKMRTGVTRDGKLTGMHVQTLVDGGGYGSYGVARTFYPGAVQTVTYELPSYKFDAAADFNKMPQCGVQLLLDRSGQVTVFCGATEIGQGSDDVLVAVVAEVLGVDPFDVRCVTGDTGITPVDLGSYSSRVTVMMGNAAIQASQKLKDLIATATAEQLEVSPDRLTFSNGKVFFENSSLSFAEAVGFAEEKFGTLGAVGSYKPPRSPGRYKGAGVGPSPAYSYTACVVEAEVEPKTGWISVPKIWIAHDIGRTINPVLARGQVEGSVYMGLSEALMEEQVFRRLPPKLSSALVHKIPSLLEYKSLTSLDMPEVDTVLIEDPDPNCPFGAKEAGQGPLLPVMPAVANAIYDAIGVRIDELPITPDKILKALELKAQGKPGRIGPDHFPAAPYPEPLIVPPPWEGGDGKEVKKNDAAAVV